MMIKSLLIFCFTFANQFCESSSGVEHHLAKVGVAGSNPVFRSILKIYQCRSGGIGRHVGLKIQWAVMPVRVQVPPSVRDCRVL